jgi:hypothetical protein
MSGIQYPSQKGQNRNPVMTSILYMEDNFLWISVVIINISVIVIFTNLVLLHDCNYAVVEENLWSRNSKYLYTY